MNPPRHQLTDKILDKMRAKGIKPTHLRQYVSKDAIKKMQGYTASFSTLIQIDELLDGGIDRVECDRLAEELNKTKSELAKYKRMHRAIKALVDNMEAK